MPARYLLAEFERRIASSGMQTGSQFQMVALIGVCRRYPETGHDDRYIKLTRGRIVLLHAASFPLIWHGASRKRGGFVRGLTWNKTMKNEWCKFNPKVRNTYPRENLSAPVQKSP